SHGMGGIGRRGLNFLSPLGRASARRRKESAAEKGVPPRGWGVGSVQEAAHEAVHPLAAGDFPGESPSPLPSVSRSHTGTVVACPKICGSHSGTVAAFLNICGIYSGTVAPFLNICGSHSGTLAPFLSICGIY